MKRIEVVDVKANILADNDVSAEQMRMRLKKEKTFFLNLMSSPGAGKTTTLLRMIEALQNNFAIQPFSMGILEADIDSDVDAAKIQETGVKVIQLHTGGMCHLDAAMAEQGLNALGFSELDLVILENVGNLVCPAEFDTGACKNACIVSVPEGDDKPLKYPLMFQVADAVFVNKIDTASYFDFDLQAFQTYVEMRHPKIPVIPYSAKTGEGMEQWMEWLIKEIKLWKDGD